MAVTAVAMPQLGESVTEGTIGKWLKQPGDKVDKYESLAEVITDKVNAEIPSPVAGVITELTVEEGATVPVGTVILSIDEGGEGAAPAPQAPAEHAPAAAPAPAPAPEPAPAAAAPVAQAAPPAPQQASDNGRAMPPMPVDMGAAVAAAMPQAQPEMYAGGSSAPAAGQVESEEELLRLRRAIGRHDPDLMSLRERDALPIG